VEVSLIDLSPSQSPYGAKWFATCVSGVLEAFRDSSRNPLTGLSGLQLVQWLEGRKAAYEVAIPLRG